MDTLVEAQAFYDTGLRLVDEGLKNLQKAQDIRKKIYATEIPVCEVEESQTERQRGRLSDGFPKLQPRPIDYGALSQQLSEARERHKHKGE